MINNDEFRTGKLNFSKFVQYNTRKAVSAVDMSRPFEMDGRLNIIDDVNRISQTNSAIGESRTRYDTIRGVYNAVAPNNPI